MNTQKLLLLLACALPLLGGGCANGWTISDGNRWFNENVGTGQKGNTIGDANRAMSEAYNPAETYSIGDVHRDWSESAGPVADRYSIGEANRSLRENKGLQETLDRYSVGNANRMIRDNK